MQIQTRTLTRQPCGQSVEDFSDPSVIETLNAHAQTPGLWALGINGYPVFSTQTDLILADYSAIDAAKAKVPEDLTIYTDETAGNLTKLLDSIDESLSKDQQSEVDAMAKAIEDAIAALEYKDADYQAVDAAIDKANALNKDEYKDFSDVEAAIAAVVRDKDITEQAAVNEMAKAIEDAVAALEYKDADYAKVDEAIAKADALNPDDYTDFSAVEAAVNAVVRGKDITEQDKVGRYGFSDRECDREPGKETRRGDNRRSVRAAGGYRSAKRRPDRRYHISGNRR